MTNKTKKPLFASGLYIALSLCILAVVGFGAYSTITDLYRDTANVQPNTNKPLTDLNLPTAKPKDETDPLPIIKPENDNTEQETQITPPKEDVEISTDTEPEERIFVSPLATDKIIKEFKIDDLVYSVTMNDYRAHTGLDIAGELGSPVCAMTDGVVESIHPDPLMGQTVVINHGDGLKTVYQNLALEIPTGLIAGIEVAAGDLIGAVGDTAIIECAEESHLHFEVQKDGICINPNEYLK